MICSSIQSLLFLLVAIFGQEHNIANAFVPQNQSAIINKNNKQRSSSLVLLQSTKSNNNELSEVEKLLAKAKELRAQAEAAETQLHTTLLEKKSTKDAQADTLIDELFPLEHQNFDKESRVETVADMIDSKRLSIEKLIQVVERLHSREVTARGEQHVEPSHHRTHVKFQLVSENPDAYELSRVRGLTDILIAAAYVLDERFLKNKMDVRGENGKVVMHHVDHSHWATGELGKTLEEKSKFLGREHDEQFKVRQAEYYEAARKKKKTGKSP